MNAKKMGRYIAICMAIGAGGLLFGCKESEKPNAQTPVQQETTDQQAQQGSLRDALVEILAKASGYIESVDEDDDRPGQYEITVRTETEKVKYLYEAQNLKEVSRKKDGDEKAKLFIPKREEVLKVYDALEAERKKMTTKDVWIGEIDAKLRDGVPVYRIQWQYGQVKGEKDIPVGDAPTTPVAQEEAPTESPNWSVVEKTVHREGKGPLVITGYKYAFDRQIYVVEWINASEECEAIVVGDGNMLDDILTEPSDDYAEYKDFYPDTKAIGLPAAVDLALKEQPDATLSSIECEWHHGKPVYEVKLTASGREIELVLDAYTGEVLKRERESI